MSTPSGKPYDPADLSAYVPNRTRAAAERDPAGSDERPPISAFAPKRAREGSGAEPVAHDSERDSELGNALGGPSAAEAPTSGGWDDDAPPTAFEHPAQETEDFAAPLQPVDPSDGGRREPSIVGRRDAMVNDRDLDRLEASLRWLQRQEAATRLARMPVGPNIAPPDAEGRRREWSSLRSPLSLEPERMAPPPSSGRSFPATLGLAVAAILAAGLGYYLATEWWGAPSAPAPRSQLAAVDRIVPAPAPRADQERRPAEARGDDAATASQLSSQHAKLSPPAVASPAAEPAPDAVAAETPPADKPLRKLDPSEIALLVKQGEQFAAAGDLVTARIVFQRAAEAGDAVAAMALGATYDPAVLAKLGVVGISADVEKARSWYEKAERFGSTEATRRLSILARQ